MRATFKIFPDFEVKSWKQTKGNTEVKALRFESNIRFERKGIWYDLFLCEIYEVECNDNEEKEITRCTVRFLTRCYINILFFKISKNLTDGKFIIKPSHNQISEEDRLKLDPILGLTI